MIPDQVPGFAVTCICNLIAAVILGVAFWPKMKGGITKRMLVDVLILAGLNLAYNILILKMMTEIPTLQATFVLSMTTVFIPFLLLVIGQRSKPQVLICMGVLCL